MSSRHAQAHLRMRPGPNLAGRGSEEGRLGISPGHQSAKGGDAGLSSRHAQAHLRMRPGPNLAGRGSEEGRLGISPGHQSAKGGDAGLSSRHAQAHLRMRAWGLSSRAGEGNKEDCESLLAISPGYQSGASARERRRCRPELKACAGAPADETWA